MKFSAKAGAGDLIRELIQRIEENGNPKSWNPSEMQNAINFLEHRVATFSKEDALAVIHSLVKKYHIAPTEIPAGDQVSDHDAGVTGLK